MIEQCIKSHKLIERIAVRVSYANFDALMTWAKLHGYRPTADRTTVLDDEDFFNFELERPYKPGKSGPARTLVLNLSQSEERDPDGT